MAVWRKPNHRGGEAGDPNRRRRMLNDRAPLTHASEWRVAACDDQDEEIPTVWWRCYHKATPHILRNLKVELW